MSGGLAALGCAVCWALSGALVRDLTKRFSSLVLNATVAFVGVLLYVVVILATVRQPLYAEIAGRDMLFLALNCVFSLVLGDTFYYSSMRVLGLSRALTISATYPLITAVLAGLLLHERFTLSTWLGFGLCVSGVVVVARSGLRAGADGQIREGLSRGVAFALAAAACWALGTVSLRVGSLGLDTFIVNSIRLSGVAFIAGTWAYLRGDMRRISLGRSDAIRLFSSAVLGAGLGATLYLMAVQRAGASVAAVLSSTSPLFSVPMSALGGEKIDARLVSGIIAAVCGVMLVV